MPMTLPFAMVMATQCVSPGFMEDRTQVFQKEQQGFFSSLHISMPVGYAEPACTINCARMQPADMKKVLIPILRLRHCIARLTCCSNTPGQALLLRSLISILCPLQLRSFDLASRRCVKSQALIL